MTLSQAGVTKNEIINLSSSRERNLIINTVSLYKTSDKKTKFTTQKLIFAQ